MNLIYIHLHGLGRNNLKRTLQIKHTPVLHNVPVYPLAQVQENPLTRSRHAPLFWHGFELHSLISEWNKSRENEQRTRVVYPNQYTEMNFRNITSYLRLTFRISFDGKKVSAPGLKIGRSSVQVPPILFSHS